MGLIVSEHGWPQLTPLAVGEGDKIAFHVTSLATAVSTQFTANLKPEPQEIG